jgi:GNAT superfamily N-acetyltransferase
VSGAGASEVRLVRFPVDLLRGLAEGRVERPADWHPQYETEAIIGITRMLLAAYEAMGVVPDDRSPWWVFGVVVDGLVVGDAGFHGPPAATPPTEVEIGYQVVPAYRARGVATRACALLLEHAWRHGADRVRAEVEADNRTGDASRGVLQANGLRPTGRGDFAVEAAVTGAT